MTDFENNQNFYGTATVGEKGQIVICKKVRKYLNVKAGDTLAVIATKKKGIILVKTDNNNKP